MKKVAIITTGGTIASKKNNDGLLECTDMTGLELMSNLPLSGEVEVIVHNLFQLPSMYLTFNHLIELKEKIEEVFRDSSIDGIVVTHGTDTLEETAYFLDLTVSDIRPVVVTGSQKSVEESGTDVFQNLSDAMHVACEKKALDLGSIVVFNGDIFASKYVKKIHTSHINGFGVSGFGHLGNIDQKVVTIFSRPTIRQNYQIIKDLPSVDIIKSYLGSDGKFIKAAIDGGTEGIILEGAGRGQVTPMMLEEIDRALVQGKKIVITSSCDEGRVFAAYDDLGSANDLMKRGVILGGDYDSKKARMKLAVLLSAGFLEIEKAFND
ncbi:asparaginase [Bacillus sp. UNC438CL73TsuS30]|uniref:asparaginase n=1 Tax=Bacillus sp. UNC438CL73TsuS30 TaxID=1340434 RepID=UPI00047B08D3|nr:asparaginase [Bacillus sp. UNC438CL73TsuS30]